MPPVESLLCHPQKIEHSSEDRSRTAAVKKVRKQSQHSDIDQGIASSLIHDSRMLPKEEHQLLLLRHLHIRRDIPDPRPGDPGGRTVNPQ